VALFPGSRIGPYEIVAALGAGGMGEVYRARDTRLDRDVAVKILPEAFASDAGRVARFQREARTLASLNHPHIGALHGLEEANGVTALIMELVEGEDLAERIARGAMPFDEALPIAKQIAEALEAAHEQGVIHRDLKPANIKVRPDGTVKVLDFGLAKAMEPIRPSANVSQSPTITPPAMTQAGMILGTAGYMSPEQVKGHAADTRADIWAFGVVLFEMLAGRRPFDGQEIAENVASILKTEPEWQRLPSDTPEAVRRLLRRCLHKDRHQRLQHMGDARVEINEAQQAPSADVTDRRVRDSRRERLLWAAAVFVTATIAAVGWRTGDTADAPEMRVEINASGGAAVRSFAISPDGHQLAFTADGQRGMQLWIRSLDDTAPRPLPGTEGGEYPFWSPDSRSIGFFANNKLKRLDIDGGQPQTLANVVTPTGATWNGEGTILYVPRDNGGVFRVRATGGDTSAVTPHRSPELSTRLPQFLPDDRHFLFYVAQGGEPAGVYVGELGSDAVRRILSADWPAMFASGHLWFVRERTLFAQPFNPSTQTLSGPVSRVANNVGGGLFAAFLSISAAGPIAYREGAAQSRRRLVWFDRSGKELGTAGEEGGLLANPSLSLDGRYVVVQRTLQANIDLWVLDLQRNVFNRLTDDPRVDSMPMWSPDGKRVVFSSGVGDGSSLMIMRIDGTANETLSLPATDVKIACDWSADGRYVLYRQLDEATGTNDLWALPMAGERTPFQIVHTQYDERDGQFSPDSKWIAYESDESGRPEIYLQAFPGPGPKVRVSIDGGTQVRWRRDGREMFYIAPDERLMAVSVDPTAGVGKPAALFTTHLAPIRSISRQQYVVASDGQRFLISSVDESTPSSITLILNWKGHGSAPD